MNQYKAGDVVTYRPVVSSDVEPVALVGTVINVPRRAELNPSVFYEITDPADPEDPWYVYPHEIVGLAT